MNAAKVPGPGTQRTLRVGQILPEKLWPGRLDKFFFAHGIYNFRYSVVTFRKDLTALLRCIKRVEIPNMLIEFAGDRYPR